jgi:hypothetical protein
VSVNPNQASRFVASHRRARLELDRIVAEANRAISRVNSEAPTLAQHRRPLDPAAEAGRLERALSG